MSVGTHFSNSGYVQIPLFRSGPSHFTVDGQINGQSVSMLLNPGCPRSMIDLNLARELNLPMVDLAKLAGVPAVPREIYQVQTPQIEIGMARPKIPGLLASEFSDLARVYADFGTSLPDVILGTDTLELLGAVIDYGNMQLMLRS